MSKPIRARRVEEVEAIQWTGDNLDECIRFILDVTRMDTVLENYVTERKIGSWIVEYEWSVVAMADDDFRSKYEIIPDQPDRLEKICTDCHGNIVGVDEMIKCHNCGGTGRVTIGTPWFYGDAECARCNGTGKVSA